MDLSRLGRRMLACSIAVVLFGAGCAEVITYSNQSNEKGEKLLAAGEYEDAAGAFANATEQNPRHYKAFYNLGQTYEKMGREQQALQAYRTGLDVMPVTDSGKKDFAMRDQIVSALAKCVATSASKDLEIEAIRQRAERSTKAIDWYVLGRTYAELGDADNALDAYDRALLAAEANESGVVKDYGLYLVQVNQNKRAEVVLRKAYQINQQDAEVNAALRKIGIVPGPSLLEPDQLSRPFIPKGPLPELEIQLKDSSDSASTGTN